MRTTCAVMVAVAAVSTVALAADVRLVRTPENGLQPQVAVDGKGTVHMVYFRGEPMAGDICYVRRKAGEAEFSAPVRVNSQAGSAIATGTVRGAHIAAGRNGRVHVAWMGAKNAEPKGPGGGHPMLYARLNDAGTAFEPQRNVAQFAGGLDGGGSLAADDRGRVWVAWHGSAEGHGEEHRRVWVARSTDDGRTFAREAPAFEESTGACACCGMRAFAHAAGRNGSSNVYLLYRSATEHVNRDMFLLASADGGRTFRGQKVHSWKIGACPMSTAHLGAGGDRVVAAWETEWQVYFTTVDPATFELTPPVAAPAADGVKRKHPVVARNARGETLLAWTEGTGWKQGGSLAWQLYDRAGKPLGETGRAPGVAVWSLAAVFAAPDGNFTVIY